MTRSALERAFPWKQLRLCKPNLRNQARIARYRGQCYVNRIHAKRRKQIAPCFIRETRGYPAVFGSITGNLRSVNCHPSLWCAGRYTRKDSTPYPQTNSGVSGPACSREPLYIGPTSCDRFDLLFLKTAPFRVCCSLPPWPHYSGKRPALSMAKTTKDCHFSCAKSRTARDEELKNMPKCTENHALSLMRSAVPASAARRRARR